MTAMHCNTLQHTATTCNNLQHTASEDRSQHEERKRISALDNEMTATHYTLQHTATHCNTLQHTATHCNTGPLAARGAQAHLSAGKREFAS